MSVAQGYSDMPAESVFKSRGGRDQRLPPELMAHIGRHLRADNAIGTLATLMRTSTSSRETFRPFVYRQLQVTDSQLRAIVSSTTKQSATGRALTTTLELISPLSSETAKIIKDTHPKGPPFPGLSQLILSSSVLRAMPHGATDLASAYDVSKAFNHKKEAICHLGPITQLRITDAQAETCVFSVLHPILPTSMGLSSFLPRLSSMLPTLQDVSYEAGFHADVIYPTTGITTTYIDPCGCWLKYGSERMGLGLALAWVGETGEGKDSTKVVIAPTSQPELPGDLREGEPAATQATAFTAPTAADVDLEREWDGFQDRVVEYLRQAEGEAAGRLVQVNGKDRLRCLDIVHGPR